MSTPTPPRPDVLMVEDSMLLLFAVEQVLSSLVRFRAAGTVEAALEMITEREPDVVICDYRVGRRNGIELLEHLATKHPRVRRILVTGMPIDQVRDELRHCTVEALLTKPIDLERLLALLSPSKREQ